MGNLQVGGVGAQQSVPAHYAHQAPLLEGGEKLVEAVADGVVVERAGQGLLDVLGLLAFLQVVAIDASVVALLVAVGMVELIAFVELVGRIEMAAQMERLAHIGEEKTFARLFFQSHRQGAAHEDAVLVLMAQGQLRLGRQVNGHECQPLKCLLLAVEHLRQLPVIGYLLVVCSHFFT